MTKRCRDCGAEKPPEDFTTGKAKCKPCLAARARAGRAANPEKNRAATATWRAANPETVRALYAAWVKANPERHRARNAIRNARVRLAALAALGGKCVQCGATEGLDIDHIHGDGFEHRRYEHAVTYIGRMARTGQPDPRLQLLCEPCHVTKTTAEARMRRAGKSRDKVES